MPGGTAPHSPTTSRTFSFQRAPRAPISVRVVATNVAGDGVPGNGDATDQDFALVVSNADEQALPVLSHDSTAVSDSTGGDGDGIVEPSESFTLSETVRNGGDATSTGIDGTLTSGTSGLSITQALSAYPNIAADATAATPRRSRPRSTARWPAAPSCR